MLSSSGGHRSILFDQGFQNNAWLQRHLADRNANWQCFVSMRLYLNMLFILSIRYFRLWPHCITWSSRFMIYLRFWAIGQHGSNIEAGVGMHSVGPTMTRFATFWPKTILSFFHLKELRYDLVDICRSFWGHNW